MVSRPRVRMIRKETDDIFSAELHLSLRQWQRVPVASVFSYTLSAVHSSASKNPQSLTITFWPLLEKLKEVLRVRVGGGGVLPLERHAGGRAGDELRLVLVVGNLAQVLHSTVMALKPCKNIRDVGPEISRTHLQLW